jgi:energy-coupling factor transporter ATP-binding protein EcfA2
VRGRREAGTLRRVASGSDTAVLVLTGAPGAGKSSVLEALSDLLADDGVGHGCLEAEQLARGHPWLSQARCFEQLAAIVRLQRGFGRTLFLVTVTAETADDLRGVLDAFAPSRSLTICLVAAPATHADRVLGREPASWSGRERLAHHARDLAVRVPELDGIDLRVDTDGRTAEDVAREVRDALDQRLRRG